MPLHPSDVATRHAGDLAEAELRRAIRQREAAEAGSPGETAAILLVAAPLLAPAIVLAHRLAALV